MVTWRQLMSKTERRYWTRRWFARHGQSVLFKIMPEWLVTQAMIRAMRHVRDDEVVPEVPFVAVFERQYKAGGRK